MYVPCRRICPHLTPFAIRHLPPSIAAPIQIGDTWHVFMDTVPEGCPALVQPVQDKPLSWAHFSSKDLVQWAEHPIAIVRTATAIPFQHPPSREGPSLCLPPPLSLHYCG